MEGLKRWRQPAALVVLVALIARLAIALIGLVVYAGPTGFGSWPLAASSLAFLVLDSTGLVLLAGLVIACAAGEPTSRVGFLIRAATVVGAVTVLLTLAFGVVGLVVGWGSPLVNVLALLVSLVPAAVATVGLAILWRGTSTVRVAIAALEDRQPLPETQTVPPEPAEDPSVAPTWEVGEASGAVWHTAGAAAAGGEASAWGSPESASGWQPASAMAPPPALAGRPSASDEVPADSTISPPAPSPRWAAEPTFPPTETPRSPEAEPTEPGSVWRGPGNSPKG